MIDRNFFILYKNKLIKFFSVFKKGEWAKILVIIVFLFIFFLLSVGVFFFSLLSFRFLNKYPSVTQPIMIYTLAVTFILTSLLILISSIITSLGALFQKEDNSLLFSLPIKWGTIFESRLVDVVILSSWPLFLFALPLILGYRQALALDFSSSLLFLLGTFLLVLLTTQIGVVIALFISYFFGNLKNDVLPVRLFLPQWASGLGNKLLGMFLFIAIPILAVGLIKLILPSPILNNLESLSVEEIAQLVNRQPLMAKFLPTTWLVNLVYFWPKDPELSMKNLAFLLLAFIPISTIILLLRGKFYFQVVNKTYVGRFLAAPHDLVKANPRAFPYLLKGKVGALTEKDWLVVLRSPAQFFQLSFIIFWQIVYFLIISRVALQKFREVFPWYQERLVKLNFLFINYLACTFAMRFFFPMISLEGQSGWIVWSAPIQRIKILGQKLISSFLIILPWIELSTFFSIKILGSSFLQHWPLFLINIPVSLTITSITLGIGAIKPNFWERNPEKLSTSPGGIIATTLCLGYIALVTILSLFRRGSLFNPLTHLAIWITSGLIIIPILTQVVRKIDKYEV